MHKARASLLFKTPCVSLAGYKRPILILLKELVKPIFRQTTGGQCRKLSISALTAVRLQEMRDVALLLAGG